MREKIRGRKIGMSDFDERSLDLHRKHHGKLEVKSKVPIVNRDDLSLAYTPGVGAVSTAIGKDAKLARELTLKHNTIAIVSDGSAILGLGNLGAEAAIPVMEGKAILFKHFADVDAFPICLATQDVEEIIATVKRIAPVFGGINLEDISAPRCFEVERRLQEELSIPVMHDDQHGTAVVVLAGLINALKVKGADKRAVRVVFSGAGAAGIAVAKLLLKYGITNIIICDSKGAIYDGREDLDADVNPEKVDLAHVTNQERRKGQFEDVIKGADIFIGVSKPGVLTDAMVKTMNPKPIIFALANPVPEIMPDQAVAAGAFIVATGRSDFPNQINNVLAFPGIFRGALDYGIRRLTDVMFTRAAEGLAAAVPHPTADVIEQWMEETREGRFIANDLYLNAADLHEEGNGPSLLLITGPNMGGKSTYLRQAAMLVLLAQMGSFVPAEKLRFGLVDRIYTRIGASDNVARGRSTFMVEMTETATILNTATRQSLILLDEMGRGTATFDGLSLAWATVEYLHAETGARTLFATHYHELTMLAEKLPRVRNLRVGVKEAAGGIVFLHNIEPGAASKSYGIEVARLAGLPAQVIERAKRVLKQHEKQERQNVQVETAEPVQLTIFTPLSQRIVDRIEATDVNSLTPLQALNLLEELQQELKEKG